MSAYDHLFGVELGRGSWSWGPDRAMLYAVGVGAGVLDAQKELAFTTENTPGVPQQIIPTFVTLMGLPTPWAEMLGWQKEGLSPVGVVHGEQSVTLYRPIPLEGTVELRKVLSGVYDKGSGALLVMDTEIALTDGTPLGVMRMNLFAQGKGGFGGPRGPANVADWPVPDGEADVRIEDRIGGNQSLIYRLSGDRHPHGSDYGRARADGFDRPIFYGLGSFGYACRALLGALCEGDAGRFGHMEARFSKPVYPGDTVTTEFWRTEDGARFRLWADGRLALDRGVFRFL